METNVRATGTPPTAPDETPNSSSCALCEGLQNEARGLLVRGRDLRKQWQAKSMYVSRSLRPCWHLRQSLFLSQVLDSPHTSGELVKLVCTPDPDALQGRKLAGNYCSTVEYARFDSLALLYVFRQSHVLSTASNFKPRNIVTLNTVESPMGLRRE